MALPVTVSLAILKVNADSHHGDYLSNFVPFVAEIIRKSTGDVVTLQTVQSGLANEFKLRVSQHVIELLLKRAKARGYINQVDRAYLPNRDKLATLDFHQLQQKALEIHDKLTSSLMSFCNEEHRTNWSKADAERALDEYLQEYRFSV